LPLCGSCFGEIAARRANADSGADGFLAVGDYAGALKDMVLGLKGSQRRMAQPLSALMAVAAGNDPRYLFPRAICYVPSSREKVKERGFNPAEILARRVAFILGRPVVDALRDPGGRQDQDRTPGSMRWRNVQGAFSVRRGIILEGPVLLVDDVLTTGATADACSRALLSAGASSVCVLVAARAVLRKTQLGSPLTLT